MKSRHYYYVGVSTEEGMAFVTKNDRATRMSFWDTKEKPLAMNKSVASDIAMGLCLNLHCAVVVESFFELEEHFVAQSKEEL